MKKVIYTYKALGDSIAFLREVSGIPVKSCVRIVKSVIALTTR